MAPNLIGPRQTTGVSSSSSKNAIEITFTPRCPCAGWIRPSSTCNLRPSRPIIFGTLGPVISMSKIPTEWPLWARDSANPVDTVDLPTPPLPDKTIILCLMLRPISCIDIFLFICAYACSICFCCCGDALGSTGPLELGL